MRGGGQVEPDLQVVPLGEAFLSSKPEQVGSQAFAVLVPGLADHGLGLRELNADHAIQCMRRVIGIARIAVVPERFDGRFGAQAIPAASPGSSGMRGMLFALEDRKSTR